MNDIIILDIPFEFGGVRDSIHPVVLKDEHNMVLIDCGYTGFLPKLEEAMAEKQLTCDTLTHVLITHQDHDHMGALSELKKKYPTVKVAAGKKEAPYISGELKSLRLEQAEAMQEKLPDEQKAFGLAFCQVLRNVQPVKVDIEVQGGDYFDWCGGCVIIDTPGHTPGHVSVYLKEQNILIAGDAAVIEEGKLMLANPQFTLDKATAEQSLERVKHFGAKKIICYHGGAF